MSEVSDFYPGDLAAALNSELAWMLAQAGDNVSPFSGVVLATETTAPFVEGAVEAANGGFAALAQDVVPNIVLDPVAGVTPDDQGGPDGFPVNYSSTPLASGNLLVNLFTLSSTAAVSGRTVNLSQPASAYRVDVYSWAGAFYYQGSAPIAPDGSWAVASVQPGTVIAFLMDANTTQPAPGSSVSTVSGWIAHSNMGVGTKLRDYFVRLMVKTDSETLQAGAAFPELPRETEVPAGDPDFVSGQGLTTSNLPAIQNRCSVRSAALAVISLTVAGLWDKAAKIIDRLNELLVSPGYLPSIVLEDAQDGTTSRWSLQSGGGSVSNILDTTEPPAASGGSKVISFFATTAPASWKFIGIGLPDSIDSILQWRYKASTDFKFSVGLTSSTGQVTSFVLVSSGTAGYDPTSRTITAVAPLVPNAG